MNFHLNHNGCELSFSIRGVGPNVLFIQGVGVHGDGWMPQIEVLSNKYACLSLDNRGMGASQPMAADPLTVDHMVDDLRAVMDHAGWRQAHLVGHCLGGLLAQAFALQYPERAQSLSLLCTFANGQTVAPLTARMMWLGMRCSIGTRAMRRRGFLGLLYPPGAYALRDHVKVATKISSIFGHDIADQPAVVKHQLRAMRNTNLSEKISGLSSIPTLVVSGTHDPIAPPSLGRQVSERISESQFVELPDAAHGVPITHRDWLNDKLDQHFRLSRFKQF